MPRWICLLHAVVLLAGCAVAPPPQVLLLGEQHDAASHQRRHAEVVRQLAGEGRLAGLALEMADAGRSTAGLPRDADDAQVREALGWSAAGWPWAPYAPAVLAAVRAGVPVLGANVPRAALAPAMGDGSLDAVLPGPAFNRLRDAVREGHCGLLDEAQVTRLARAQVAKDRTIAGVLRAAARPGATVVLLAGAQHVDAERGVPVHLDAAGVRWSAISWPAEAPAKDYCAELRLRMRGP